MNPMRVPRQSYLCMVCRTPHGVGPSTLGGMIVQKYLESFDIPAAVLMACAPPRGVAQATMRVALRHPLVFIATAEGGAGDRWASLHAGAKVGGDGTGTAI